MAEQLSPKKVITPRADVLETEDSVVIMAEMPGVTEKDVSVTVENGVLTLRGETHFEKPEGLSLSFSEYTSGNYERSFRLSNQIDRERIDASMKNGVLSLKLPKAEAQKQKKIEVRIA